MSIVELRFRNPRLQVTSPRVPATGMLRVSHPRAVALKKGYVKELKGDKKVLLLPGTHKIVLRQPWYKDYVEEPLLEPGNVHIVNVALVKDGRTSLVPATAELKISAIPARAAVFVDDQFAGHVDEFDGPGQAMLVTPGQHRVRIALPGYLPFDTMVDLRPNQKAKIQTALLMGSISEAGSLVSKNHQ